MEEPGIWCKVYDISQHTYRKLKSRGHAFSEMVEGADYMICYSTGEHHKMGFTKCRQAVMEQQAAEVAIDMFCIRMI